MHCTNGKKQPTKQKVFVVKQALKSALNYIVATKGYKIRLFSWHSPIEGI